MENRDLKVAFNELLNAKDTEKQTYGHRANNSNICASNLLPDACAFSSSDCICKRLLGHEQNNTRS